MNEELKAYGETGSFALRKMREAAELEPHEAAAEFERLKADVEALAGANLSNELLLLCAFDLAIMAVLARRGDIHAGAFDDFLREL
jgi:hypothetical protein